MHVAILFNFGNLMSFGPKEGESAYFGESGRVGSIYARAYIRNARTRTYIYMAKRGSDIHKNDKNAKKMQKDLRI